MPEFDERVIAINRVAKVVKGGRRFSFTALVTVGNGNGRVGIGYGKAKEVPTAIQKGIEIAARAWSTIPMAGKTIIHAIIGEQGASRVLIKPAAPGTGVIAGGAVRQILEAAGINDVLGKSLGSPTQINVAKATMDALDRAEAPRRGCSGPGKTSRGDLSAGAAGGLSVGRADEDRGRQVSGHNTQDHAGEEHHRGEAQDPGDRGEPRAAQDPPVRGASRHS